MQKLPGESKHLLLFKHMPNKFMNIPCNFSRSFGKICNTVSPQQMEYVNVAIITSRDRRSHRVGRVLSVSPVVGIETPPPL